MTAYVWGFGKCGQLGNGQTDTVHTPVRPKLPAGTKLIEINCGGYYTSVIDCNGHLYSFGCGKYGRLGTGDEADRNKPVKINICDEKDATVKFKKVSCGIWHGAAIADSNNLYIWGYGKSHGVLGDLGESLSTPRLLTGPFSCRVAGVSCGNNYTLLWTIDGTAFSWGCGRHGVLGHDDVADKSTPLIILKFQADRVRISFMSAGFAHCGAVTDSGKVYMFGKGEDGALGLGKSPPHEVSQPTAVQALLNVLELSCSVGEKHGHTLFVTDEGRVYACGDGYKGKLGLGDQLSRFEPTILPSESFNHEFITHVSAGGIHSAAVSQKGHVFTWGCGSDGRLGHPEGQGHRYLFRSDVPRVVEALSKVSTATRISCSYYHTAALVEYVEDHP